MPIQSTPDPQPAHDPRYPIGRPALPASGEAVSAQTRMDAIRDIAELPEQLRNAVSELDRDQLATPYREGGWTVRQLVHHLADSHMMANVRIRLALTEDTPAISTYKEDAWARLHDGADAPVEWSLELIEALHARWVMLLQSLTEEQWQRAYLQEGVRRTIDKVTLIYAWHSRHHVAHITHLRAAKGW